MDGFVAWVRGILYLLFFVTLVQLLLPDDALRKYVRLIVGLVVLAALIQPIAGLLSNPQRFGDMLEGLLAFDASAPRVEDSIADGERLRNDWLEGALAHDLAFEQRRIEGYMSLVEGVQGSRVERLTFGADGSVSALDLVVYGDRDRLEERVVDVLTKVLGIPERVMRIVWEHPEGA